jgi:hypothetical protein
LPAGRTDAEHHLGNCTAKAHPLANRPSLLLVLGPAQQFTPETQGFIPQLEVARMRDGALQGVDQLGDGGEDRAVVRGERIVTILRSRFLMVVSGIGVPLWNRGEDTRKPQGRRRLRNARILKIFA